MDYIQFTALFTTMLSGFGFLYREMKGIQKDLKDETKTIQQETLILRQEIQVQAKRSDDLYRMFIDLVKEGRKK